MGTGPTVHFAAPQMTHPIEIDFEDFQKEGTNKISGIA